MFYGNNGNILSKTGLGSYEYSNTSKPHAVTAVDNTDDLLEYVEQEVEYNLWGKVSDVWHYDGYDHYHYQIEYGPDLERVRSTLYDGNQFEYEKFYFGDYEEKRTSSETGMYWYVYTPDGLSGFYYKEDSQNGIWTDVVAAMTDHLGSITCLMDDYDYCYEASYDPWGFRDLDMDFYQPFDRGFCGHEHIDALGLIDMNGRMYDPNLVRFLSPDNYIQSPGNPQNYNRYSYCLNNPLKYTDPSGEKISWLWGLAVGLNLVPIEAAMAFVTVATTDAITSGTVGFVDGIIHGDLNEGFEQAAKRATNSIKIATGMLQSDELDGCEFSQFARSYFRSEWCSPSSLLGYAYSCNANIFDRVDVDDYYGATVVRSKWSKTGVTFGHYIMINSDIDDYKSLLIHEYGHFMQSRDWGGFSALSGGVFSLASSMEIIPRIGKGHEDMWIEKDASIRGARHLKKEYNSIKTAYDEENPQEYYDLRMLHNMFIPFSLGYGIYNIINPN